MSYEKVILRPGKIPDESVQIADRDRYMKLIDEAKTGKFHLFFHDPCHQLHNTIADVEVEVEGSEIVFRSTGELYGLNIFATNITDTELLTPETVLENGLSATNWENGNHAIGICTAYAPEENAEILRIPFTGKPNPSVTFDMWINSEFKIVTLGLPTEIKTLENEIEIFPNPVKNILRIEGIENAEISVYTIDGKLVKTEKLQNNELNISELSAGNYLIKIGNGKETITKQIVKE